MRLGLDRPHRCAAPCDSDGVTEQRCVCLRPRGIERQQLSADGAPFSVGAAVAVYTPGVYIQ